MSVISTWTDKYEAFGRIQEGQYLSVKDSLDSDRGTRWVLTVVPNGADTPNPQRGRDGGVWLVVHHLEYMTKEQIAFHVNGSNGTPFLIPDDLDVPVCIFKTDGYHHAEYFIVPKGWEMVKTSKYTGRMRKKEFAK